LFKISFFKNKKKVLFLADNNHITKNGLSEAVTCYGHKGDCTKHCTVACD
jgi:hypothetical protein